MKDYLHNDVSDDWNKEPDGDELHERHTEDGEKEGGEDEADHGADAVQGSA